MKRPFQAFRKDLLTVRYRALRTTKAAAAAGESQAKKARARTIAGELIARHGFRAVIEDSNIAAWSRAWGRPLAAFSPGTLVAAMESEAEAVRLRAHRSGGVVRASTARTALSQHCLCGARVQKTLSDRVHKCHACGLTGDRDAVSALLGSFVILENPEVAACCRHCGTALS